MSLSADTIVDRRRLRRKLTFWRVLAVLLAIAAVATVASLVATPGGRLAEASGTYIARVKITGLIRGDEERTEALDNLAKSRVRAVVVHIDSPGGTTAGSEQLHDALRRVAAAKPTVIVIDGLAASGGYIAAMAGDHIVSQGTSLGARQVLFTVTRPIEEAVSIVPGVTRVQSRSIRGGSEINITFAPTTESKPPVALPVMTELVTLRPITSAITSPLPGLQAEAAPPFCT